MPEPTIQQMLADSPPATLQLKSDTAALLRALLQVANSISGTPGGTPGAFTNANVGASASATIPAGARNWSVVVITGTATVGSASALPAGFALNDAGPLNADLTVTTDAASTAYVQYIA